MNQLDAAMICCI